MEVVVHSRSVPTLPVASHVHRVPLQLDATALVSPSQMIIQFLPRDALVHSAVLRLHVVRLSVCL